MNAEDGYRAVAEIVLAAIQQRPASGLELGADLSRRVAKRFPTKHGRGELQEASLLLVVALADWIAHETGRLPRDVLEDALAELGVLVS